jgi:hypothetical protein
VPEWQAGADQHVDGDHKLGWSPARPARSKSKDALKRRIEEATKFIDLDRLCLSPQCAHQRATEQPMLGDVDLLAVGKSRNTANSWHCHMKQAKTSYASIRSASTAAAAKRRTSCKRLSEH